MAESADILRHLPLTPAMFHVLLALADTTRHGYGIMKEIAQHTSGELRMGAGTLYGTIQRLLDLGWVIESAAKAAVSARDERRRFYRLTPLGRRVLGAEVERLEDLVRVAHRTRGVPRSTKS
jgi:DNA-binding PadR family transcriptional regulator